MRFIANENVSATVIERLREAGHDVLSVKETMRGASDDEVLTRAQAEHRIVLTHDRDFGELTFRVGAPASCGVILLRLSGNSPDIDDQRAINAIQSRGDWAGQFSVVTNDRVRMRSLPEASRRDEGRTDV